MLTLITFCTIALGYGFAFVGGLFDCADRSRELALLEVVEDVGCQDLSEKGKSGMGGSEERFPCCGAGAGSSFPAAERGQGALFLLRGGGQETWRT